MRIKEIKAVPLRVPLDHRFQGSVYSMTERCTIITSIITDEGVVSETFLGDTRDQQQQVVELINNKLSPLLAGENPLRIEACWQKMFKETIPLPKHGGGHKLLFEAMGAVDVALWNLMGLTCNKPIYQLLGGFTDGLQPIVIGAYYEAGKDLSMLADEILRYRELGFAGAKVKVGGLAPLDDVKRVEAIRKAVGEDLIIACDANRGWTRDEAVQFGLGVKDLNIRWFEEPVHWYDEIPGMSFVRQRTGLPVTAGQSEFSSQGCLQLIEGGAVDILNYDIKSAGISEWLKVAKMAEVHQIEMAHHEEPLLSMHLLAAISNGLYPEYFSELRDPLTPHIVLEQPEIKGGWVKLPEKPGFGLELNQEFIEKYRVA